MARIRTLKPELWADEALGSVSIEARLLYIGLITQADDHGRFRAAPPLLRSAIFPYDEDMGSPRVAASLCELRKAGLVVLYTVREESYGYFPTWGKHQRVDNAAKGGFPAPDEGSEDFAASRRESPRVAAGSRIKEGIKEGIKEQGRAPADADAVDRVWQAYQSHHPAAKMSGKRRDLIVRRLRDYEEGTLIDAINGNHLSPFHCGDNKTGTTYHSLELILRDADKIETFAAMAGETPLDRISRKSKVTARELAQIAAAMPDDDNAPFLLEPGEAA